MFQRLNNTIPPTTTLSAIFERYRIALISVYILGLVLMIIYNFECYPGTNVGRIGWALIWPVSVWGYLWEYWLSPDAPDAIFRAGCFLIEEGIRKVR